MGKPSLLQAAEDRTTDWRRSSACVPDDLCVEIWLQRQVVRVRDAKDRGGAELRFCTASWLSLVAHVTTQGDLPRGAGLS